jgi:CheY-like chemotaxis protein
MTPKVSLKPIVLVDDDEHHVELATDALRAGGLANPIIPFNSGEAALDYFFDGANHERARMESLAECPCLVVLDLRLMDIDGLAVLKRLKQDRLLQLVPVMLLTTSADERDIKRGYDLQANAYLTKPVDFHMFIEKVQQAGIFWVLVNEPSPP